MKFYFCQACGVRVTEDDIDDGLARNKKLKGVYCSQCAVGVTTMEELPVTKEEAKKLLDADDKAPHPAAPPASVPRGARKTSGVRIPSAPRTSSSRMTQSAPTTQSSSARFLVPAIVTAAVVVVGLVVFSGSGRKPSRKARDRNAHKKREDVSRLPKTDKRNRASRSAEVVVPTEGPTGHTPTEPSASKETVSTAQPASSEDGPSASSSAGTQTETKVGQPASKETKSVRAPEPSESAKAAKAKFDAYLGAFDEAFFKGDQAAACEAAKRAKSDASLDAMAKEVGLPAEALAKVGALAGVADALVAAAAAKKQALEALLGKKRTFLTRKGSVTGVVSKVEGETLRVKVEGQINKQVIEYEKRVKVSDLTPSFRAKLLDEKAPETPDGWVALAIQGLAAGNLETTGKALAQAGTHPLRSHYRRRLDVARLGLLEVEAKEFYNKRLKPLLGIAAPDKETAGPALKVIREFRERYGGTSLSNSADLNALERRMLRVLAVEWTFRWNCADVADVYVNGKPLREYKSDFRTRNAEHKSTYAAKANLVKGDVITVGARRGQYSGILLIVIDENGEVVWKTDEENWRLYDPVDPDRWFLPEVALKSKAKPVTFGRGWSHCRNLNEKYGSKAKQIWRSGADRFGFFYSVFGGIKARQKRTAEERSEQATASKSKADAGIDPSDQGTKSGISQPTPANTAPKSTPVDPAHAKLGTYLKAFDEAFFKGDQAGASEAAKRAKKDASLKDLAAEVEALSDVANALAASEAVKKQALEALPGKKQAFQTRKGLVTGVVNKVEGETLRVMVEGRINKQVVEYEKRVKLSELTPACRARVLGEKEPETAAEWVLAALRSLAAKDADETEKALTKAGAHPLTAHYRQRLAKLRLEEREAAARREWEQQVLPLTKPTKLSKSEAQKGKKVLSAFRSNHGKTAFAASVAAQSKELERAIKLALGLPKEVTLDLGNGVKMEFVLIPAGTFMMGDPPEENVEGNEKSKPQHQVTLSKPYYLGKYEVTRAQYDRVLGRNPTEKSPDSPVSNVSWLECQAFCKKLSTLTGRRTRLPTEAEWEHACRAGTTTRIALGDSGGGLRDYCWMRMERGFGTKRVGQKKPNPFGLYDMYGNVVEWCQDRYGAYAAEAVTDPKGPATGDLRVLRGGGYFTHAHVFRSAYRGGAAPSSRYVTHGLRVALDY